MISVAETVVRKRADLLDYVSKKFHKTVSVWTIGRILKEAGFVWKRMRKSCKPRRDEVLFAFFKEELRLLKQMEDNDEIELFFFDEAGFSLQPVVPYAWQRIGQTQIIPATQGKNFTVMGMINRKGQFQYQMRDKAPKTDDLIEFFDQFNPQKKSIVIMDQASTHTAQKFKEQTQRWKEKNLYIQYLPKASPELNYIEMLWKKIKYQWIPREAYISVDSLKMHLETILDCVGKDYHIHFA
ncbi:MAG: IS630 family transposase [Bacteroidota bacterium]